MSKKTLEELISISTGNPWDTQVLMYGCPPPEDHPWRPGPVTPFVPSIPLDGPHVTVAGPSATELELMQEITKLKVDLSRAAAEIERLKKAIGALVET